jgi:hypothetical protein
MSPKSRGRPKGRGRTPARRQRPAREPSQVDQVLREAPALESIGRLEAQLVASGWLGGAWRTRGMGERGAEAALVRELIAAAGRAGKPAAYLALHALATIAHEDWREELADALDDAPAEPRPAWAVDPRTAGPEQPVRAQRWSDPWGSEAVYILRYTEPEEHVLLVSELTVGGRWVTVAEVGRQDGEPDEKIDELTAEEMSPEDALAEIADALDTTDMYWPPQDSPDYTSCRALAHWRTRGHLVERDFTPISEQERRQLIDDFAAGHAHDVDADIVEVLADTFVDFGDGYLHGGVLAWSPGEVERFMLDWVQRKVLLEAQDVEALPGVLREWVAFVLRRRGLAEEHIAPVVEAVDEYAADFRDLESDPEQGGPAKQIMSRLLAEGVDPTDQEAVNRVIGAYNAEQNARRLLESDRST